MVYLFITAIMILTVWAVLKDSINTMKYESYWTIKGDGKVLKRKSGKITLYNNIKVWHGQLDYKVKKIVRDGKKIRSVICEDEGVTRVFNIS